LHGVLGGRPKGHPEHSNSRTARLEGRRSWLERMRRAKAGGLIKKIPGGRRAKSLPRLSTDPTIRRAQRIIEAQMEKRELPIPDSPALSAERPWHEKSRGEKLAKNADLSLDFNNQLLNLVPASPIS